MIAHQFKPGQVANPLGGRALRREKRDLDREARRLALDHAPEAMRRAVELMRSKTRSSDYSQYSREELAVIEQAPTLIMRGRARAREAAG